MISLPRRADAVLPTVAVLAVLALAGAGRAAPRAAPVYGYQVVGAWQHDPRAFTEGLAVHGGFLYESTGRDSSLRKIELKTGRVVRSVALARRYYGEGMTLLDGRVYQVTWTQGTAFVYDAETLRRIRTVRYSGEGWGLARYGKLLALSDGTPVVRFVDPATFAVRRKVTVRGDDGQPLSGLNELELVGATMCANLFGADRIACFDPVSGRVRSWIDLTDLLPPELRSGDEDAVLNGIAYNGRRGRLIVTGKLWPRLFEIRLVQKT